MPLFPLNHFNYGAEIKNKKKTKQNHLKKIHQNKDFFRYFYAQSRKNKGQKTDVKLQTGENHKKKNLFMRTAGKRGKTEFYSL